MARRLRPKLPILLASGYAADVLAQHGADGEFELLTKPFAHDELLRRMAKAMEAHTVRSLHAANLSEAATAT